MSSAQAVSPSRFFSIQSFIAAAGYILLFAVPAHAQTYTLLHYFRGAEGAFPRTALVRDSAGTLYGSAPYGGIYQKCDSELGGGTVYKIGSTGKATILHAFNNGTDSCAPDSALVLDSGGNLYGTNVSAVFKLNTADTIAALHSFSGVPDGLEPFAGVVRDASGNFYGTTLEGGLPACSFNIGCGTIFKLDANGKETVLYSFTGGDDGYYPQSPLILDVAGNLYGTAYYGGFTGCPGGHGCGTIFKLDPAGNFTVLHSFTGGADGSNPASGLTLDSADNLYGVTLNGGDLGCPVRYAHGCGTVFKLSASRGKTTIHAFTGGSDGQAPSGTLAIDSAGNLYGTTEAGGDNRGDGTVFKIDATGNKTVLHQFNSTDGSVPQAGVILDPTGNLYGTTAFGGSYGQGVVFKIAF